MVFGNNGRTLEQLLTQARTITYIEPQKEYSHWTEDEINMKSIYISLQTREQTDSMLYLCRCFPPIKILLKAQLKVYINEYKA
jgi:hypothetical protein